MGTQWAPPVDGRILPASPLSMLRAGKAHPGVDIILGSNRDEGSTFLYEDVRDSKQFEKWTRGYFGNETGGKVAELCKSAKNLPLLVVSWSVLTHCVWVYCRRQILQLLDRSASSRTAATARSGQAAFVL